MTPDTCFFCHRMCYETKIEIRIRHKGIHGNDAGVEYWRVHAECLELAQQRVEAEMGRETAR